MAQLLSCLSSTRESRLEIIVLLPPFTLISLCLPSLSPAGKNVDVGWFDLSHQVRSTQNGELNLEEKGKVSFTLFLGLILLREELA